MATDLDRTDWWENPPFIGPKIQVTCKHPRHQDRQGNLVPRNVATFGLVEVAERDRPAYTYPAGMAHDTSTCVGLCSDPSAECARRTRWAVRTPLTAEVLDVLHRIEAAGRFTPDLMYDLDEAQWNMIQRDARHVAHAGDPQATEEPTIVHKHLLTVAQDLLLPEHQRRDVWHPLWGNGARGTMTAYSYAYLPQAERRQRPVKKTSTNVPPRIRWKWSRMFDLGFGLVCDGCQRYADSAGGRHSGRVDVSEARMFDLLDQVHAAGVDAVTLRTLARMNSRG